MYILWLYYWWGLMAGVSSIREFAESDFEDWRIFKASYGKIYPDPEVDSRRMKIYFRNKDYIHNFNHLYQQGLKSHMLRINHYGEMYPSEFREIVNGFINTEFIVEKNVLFKKPAYFVAPDSIDWRERGAVSEVKDQGQCGACWAFSAVGAIEGQYYFHNGELVLLSEQNLIDCSVGFGINGCRSGSMKAAFNYLKESGGINPESRYPYEAFQGPCKFNPDDTIPVKSYINIPEGDEEALKEAVAYIGPISAAMDARHLSFQFYGAGIYYNSECTPNNLTRGVLIVGYGTSVDGVDYWIIKNSCSVSWGEEGYMRVARNRNNHCGIASVACYPLLF